VYFDRCSRCHGQGASSSNVIPDLRRSPALTNRDLWRAIVIDGALLDRGMIGWSHLLNAPQAESIRAYVAQRARILQQDLATPAAN